MDNHTQTEAVHLDHALHGADLDSLTNEHFDSENILYETLNGVSEDRLRALAIKMIQVYDGMKEHIERRVHRAKIRNQIGKISESEFLEPDTNNSLIDEEIFKAVKKLGGAPKDYMTFARLIIHEDNDPRTKITNNPHFVKWVSSKAHLYGFAVTAAFIAKMREDVYMVLAEDMQMEVRVIFLSIMLFPLMMGISLKIAQMQLKKVMDMLHESRNAKNDERIDYVHKCLRYLVRLKREHQATQEDNKSNIEAKIELVKKMVRKVINEEEDLIEPEEYGGKLQITGHSVLKSIETDF